MQSDIFNIKSDEEFEEIALQLFKYQIINNPIYKNYAKLVLRNKTPINIYEIPFLPIDFFKSNEVICKNKNVETIFLSSGTGGERSKHLISDIELYKQSFLKSFELFYGDVSQYCILSLLPNYREQGASSLVYMVDELIKESKNKLSGFYLNNYEKLAETINVVEEKNQKTILFGVTYALLDFAEQFPTKLKSTIIIETGGSKGKRKEYIKEELHNILKQSFCLENIHSEYGMTELLSQSYSKSNGVFKSPPWKKIIIRDPHDPFSIVEANKTGGINIIDLANIYSCPFIATQDLGKTYEDESFSILGRFDNSDLRGCNQLTI